MGAIGIFTTDRDLNIVTWDAWLEKATGIHQSEIKGRSLVSVIPDIEDRILLRRFHSVINEGVVEVLSPVFHRYLIPVKPLEPSVYFDRMQQRVTIAPLREHETIIGTIVTIEDLTDKLEKEKRYSEMLKSTSETERLQAAQALVAEERIEQKEVIRDVLKDDSWRVRKVAVEGLKKRPDRDTVGSLLLALKEEHQNINVLNSAIQILTMSEMDVTDTLLDFLKSPDHELRQYAALSLGEIGDPRAVPALIDALYDKDMNVRFHAIEALGKMKATEAVEPITGIVETRDFFLAFPAIDALVSIGDGHIAPRLVPLLEDEMLVSPALDALGALGGEDVISSIVSLLNSGSGDAASIVRAIVSIYDRYVEVYGDGSVIADAVIRNIDNPGAGRILALLEEPQDEFLHSITVILGWLKGKDIDRTLTRLLGNTKARKEIIDAVVQHGQEIVDLLIEQIDSEDMETRKAAIVALGRIGDRRAVPSLVAALRDEPAVAVIAAGALAKIGDRAAFEGLIELMGERDAGVRQAVISALNSIGHPDMAARMAQYLIHEDPIVRESAVRIAGYFGYEVCIDLILERCSDESENVRYAAIQCLPFLEDKRAFETIVKALEGDTPRVRAAAAYALGQLEEKDAILYLKKALQDKDPWVRYFASKSAGEKKDPEVLEILSQMVQNDPANQVRISAVEAIGNIGSANAVSILARFIGDDNFDIARTAINALGKVNHPDAITYLLSSVHSSDRAIRVETIKALGNRGGKEAIEVLKWVASSDKNEEIAAEAIESLCHIGSREAIAALIELTSDKSKRNICVAKLSQFLGRYIEWIAEGLKNKNPVVRSSIVDVLARMRHPDATEALVLALEDEDTSVRLAAVNALGYLGSRYGDKKLAKIALQDPDDVVRIAAERVLKAKG